MANNNNDPWCESQTYDLEDAVTVSEKPAARSNIRDILSLPRVPGIREQAVRINSIGTGLALEDLTEVVHIPPLEINTYYEKRC